MLRRYCSGDRRDKRNTQAWARVDPRKTRGPGLAEFNLVHAWCITALPWRCSTLCRGGAHQGPTGLQEAAHTALIQ